MKYTISVQGRRVMVHQDTPSMNVLGFEHHNPTGAAQALAGMLRMAAEAGAQYEQEVQAGAEERHDNWADLVEVKR